MNIMQDTSEVDGKKKGRFFLLKPELKIDPL